MFLKYIVCKLKNPQHNKPATKDSSLTKDFILTIFVIILFLFLIVLNYLITALIRITFYLFMFYSDIWRLAFSESFGWCVHWGFGNFFWTSCQQTITLLNVNKLDINCQLASFLKACSLCRLHQKWNAHFK